MFNIITRPKKKTVIKTLACADTERKHTSEQMCNMFNITLQKFEIPSENVLALIVDNASNMTKTVERLNQNGTPALPEETTTSSDDEDGDDSEYPIPVHIHHMSCVVHTLQLSIKDCLKQSQCNKLLTKTRYIVAKLRSPNILSLLEKRGKKRPVLDMATRWGSTYLMIKRFLELRNSIEELGVVSPELHLSSTTWSSLEELLSVLEVPYAVTLKLQAENLTSGVFMKEWCSLKHTLHKKQTPLALEILKSMENREVSLFQIKLFLAGVFVGARYRILLSEEQMEVAKAGLIEVALKSHHCSISVSNSSSTENAASESIQVNNIIRSSTSSPVSEEDDFEKELDLLEQRRSPGTCTSSKTNAFNQVMQELNSNIEKMIQSGRLKGENVWKIIANLEEPLQTTAKILSTMPITQVSVERLFSSMKFILNDQRSSTKQDLLEAILLLRANGDVA